MIGRTDGSIELLPIPQDFVPCRDCCLITLREFTSNLQGKGTADLMMPMCNWFLPQFRDFMYFSCSRFLEVKWEESFKIDKKMCVAVDKELTSN